MAQLSPDARRELWEGGYRWYAPSQWLNQPECVHLSSVESHIARFVQVVGVMEEQLGDGAWTTELTDAWGLSEQWLRMASGITFVDLELSSFDAPWMCSGAMDYDEAAGRCAQLIATEYTRLLYVWNAIEALVDAMGLPDVPGQRGIVHRVCQAISAACGSETLDHYDQTLRHLYADVQRDPWLRVDDRLQASFGVRPWRSHAAVLFAASAQLRHVLAHGALRLPSPDAWGRSLRDGDEPMSADRIHIPRLGTRGLLLGLQSLLAAIVPADLRIPVEDLPGWAEELALDPDVGLRDLLCTAHLVSPD